MLTCLGCHKGVTTWETHGHQPAGSYYYPCVVYAKQWVAAAAVHGYCCCFYRDNHWSRGGVYLGQIIHEAEVV